MAYSKLEVNSALDTLVSGEGDINNALRVVIQFGSSLPLKGKFSAEIRFPWRAGDKNNLFSGFTQEQGNITIKDSKDEEEYKKYSYIHKERIGYYKIYHTEGSIIFHHFWKSDITTQPIDSSKPDKFRIRYRRENLSPIFYGRQELRTIFRIGLLHFCKVEIIILHDLREVKREREFGGYALII